MPLNPEDRIRCFPPLIDKKTKILILGTIPGNVSLATEMYYANENNHFWDFIYRILDSTFPLNGIVQRDGFRKEHYNFLLAHNIGLWDVIKDCTRMGSNDSKIKDPKSNLITEIVQDSIKLILCNGAEAHKYLKQSSQLNKLPVPVKVLGSTSTMNPNNTFKLLNEWREEFQKWL